MRTIWTIQDTLHLHTNPRKMHSSARVTYSEYLILRHSSYLLHYYPLLPYFILCIYLFDCNTRSIGIDKQIDVNKIFISRSGAKRKHIMVSRMDDIGSGSTGLTQEIDIMDIGSSTPKRKKSKSPLKGVLKIRYVLYSSGIHSHRN